MVVKKNTVIEVNNEDSPKLTEVSSCSTILKQVKKWNLLKVFGRAGVRTRGLSHAKRMWYHYTTLPRLLALLLNYLLNPLTAHLLYCLCPSPTPCGIPLSFVLRTAPFTKQPQLNSSVFLGSRLTSRIVGKVWTKSFRVSETEVRRWLHQWGKLPFRRLYGTWLLLELPSSYRLCNAT